MSAPPWALRQEALDQVETKFARRAEIGVVLDTDRHRAGAELIGGIDGMAAELSLRAVMRATNHQFRLDLDFDERKIPQLQQRGPFAAEAINRNGDLA
jgi:hypothetical protein